jgi:hypothetical protein
MSFSELNESRELDFDSIIHTLKHLSTAVELRGSLTLNEKSIYESINSKVDVLLSHKYSLKQQEQELNQLNVTRALTSRTILNF